MLPRCAMDQLRLPLESSPARQLGTAPFDIGSWCDRYGSFVRRVVARRLASRARRRVDPSDVVNCVWMSILRNPHNMPTTSCSLVRRAFIRRLAIRQVIKHHRRHLYAACRSVAREVRNCTAQLVSSDHPDSTEADSAGQDNLARILDTIATELSSRDARILTAKKSGLSNREVARELKVNEGTVRRVVRRIARDFTRRCRSLD